MIQEIYPQRFHNEYTPRPAKPEDIVFVFRGKTVLTRTETDGTMVFPKAEEVDDSKLQYLFSIDDRGFFLGDEPPGGYEFLSTRTLRCCKPQDLCFAGMTAWHLYNWYDTHRFCGRCGEPALHHTALRAMECPKCGNQMFPVIAPAVIVAVTYGDKLLLTRYADRGYLGMALIAGFCEIGETAEETVHRETMEEAGIRVKNVRYFGSQPWGFGSNLLLGYFAELEGDPTIHMDEQELQFAQWIPREDLAPTDNPVSLTATMIEHFRTGGNMK